MHRRFQTRLVMATMSLLAGVVPVAAQDNRPTLAVISFDAAPGGWTIPPPQLGATVAELMLDQLVSAETFRVLDGQWLQYGSHEAGDRRLDVLRDNARQAGVDFLVLGSITKFSNEHHQRTVGAAGFHIPIIGGVRKQQNELAVGILVRVVDVRSGEVVATTSGQGSASRKKVGVGALGLLGGPVGALVSTGGSQSRDAQLDEAVQQAVASASAGLVKAAPRLLRARIDRASDTLALAAAR